jgi:transcriptional regulator with XRE-family HTH domain
MPESHASLGDFLRALRDRRQPADFGLPPGQRRRAPGLRREEAAQLCGISPTWLTWLEQGRRDSASTVTLEAICRGLRLSNAERHYLFELAARSDPRPRHGAADRHALQALVDTIAAPAYLLDRNWDALAWNKPAAELFADWLGANGAAGNQLAYVFLHPSAPQFIVDWPQRCRRLVAEFRADCAGRFDETALQQLIARLAAASDAFRTAWTAQQVQEREGGLRAFVTAAGQRDYHQHTLRPADDPALKLVVLVARAPER